LDHFGLGGTSEIRLDLQAPDSAVLQINGKRLPDGFRGTYFDDIPILVRATPRLGYTFSHWETRSTVVSSEKLVSTGSVWKYSDTGADLGAAWQQTGYADTAWPSGPAQLGYGDGDEATVVGYGGDADRRHITTYFRKSFQLTDVTRFHSLSLFLLVDDGAVAYLNGQEIARFGMPSGSIYSATPASQGNENSFAEFQVSPDRLKSGVNTLAVEIHQSGRGSSDISFDCSLSGETSAVAQTKRVDTPEVEITPSGDVQLTAFLNAAATTVADPIVITEINFASAPEADSDDWIELYNRTTTAIDLTGWQFTDGAGHAYVFPAETVLWPNSYLVLCQDRIKFKAVHPDVKNRLGNFGFGLSGDGESLRVLDPKNKVIDQVDYKSVAPWPQTARGTGYTIELMDASSDNNLGKNWRALTPFGTPGTAHK
ncbi:MAG: lamin tail domain-containing protein, partial [Planctomycetaceae bacterium]